MEGLMLRDRQRVVWTYADYCELPDDRNRYEILEGELVVNPAPNTGHQRAVGGLYLFLRNHVRRSRLGEVFLAPYDVLLSDTTVVQPDLLFVARERLAIVLPAHVVGPPDLVIEVLSPSTANRDQGLKRDLYARFGVPHYWLADPVGRELAGFDLHGGTYRQVAAARDEELFTASPFPDLQIPLAEVWD
jgi:Uma2 family endonuclease